MKKIIIVNCRMKYTGGGAEDKEDTIPYCHLGADKSNLFEEVLCYQLNSMLSWNRPNMTVKKVVKTNETSGYVEFNLKQDEQVLDARVDIECVEVETFGTED